MDRGKNIEVLIEALKSEKELKMTIDIYAIVQGEPGHKYQRELELLAKGDARIKFHAAVPHKEVISLIASFANSEVTCTPRFTVA